MKSAHSRWSWGLLIGSEAFSAAVGFFVLLRVARLLGPSSFSSLEYATAIAGLTLVWVRGGVETITHREAARNPRLIGPLSEALLWTKLGLAALGIVAILAFALVSRDLSVTVMLSAGSILIPSALCLDVGPRSRCEFAFIAGIQFLRCMGLALATFTLVSGAKDVALAAASVVLAESLAAIGYAIRHFAHHGCPSLRFRGRTIRVLLARGSVTSLGRFTRVFLYSADLLILGLIVGSTELGKFAAARRIVFAILGIGLVVPASLGPLLAKSWATNPTETRRRFDRSISTILWPTLAGSLGLAMTARGWMSQLFHSAYSSGGITLSIFALRWPVLLVSAVVMSGLIATRHESSMLRLLLAASLLTCILVPIASVCGGPNLASLTMLAVEFVIAWGGWRTLTRIGAASGFPPIETREILAIVTLVCVVLLSAESPVWVTSLLGATVYFCVRSLTKRLEIAMIPARLEASR